MHQNISLLLSCQKYPRCQYNLRRKSGGAVVGFLVGDEGREVGVEPPHDRVRSVA